MIALVSGTAGLRRYADSGVLGQLHVPADRNLAVEGVPWAMDNGAFSGFEKWRFFKMLDRFRERKGCLWVTAPDVVANAEATLELFRGWAPYIRDMGYPVALVAQDGLHAGDLWWHEIDALFIGGSTEFKLSETVRDLIREAQDHRKWVHVGRVNSTIRLRYLQALGVDSIDGSKYSRWPDDAIPALINTLQAPQLGLEV